jgi:hypothetical protein
VPQLWEQSRILAHQVERNWVTVLSGQDVLSQEIVARDVESLRRQLLGTHPSPLEILLVDRICVCSLALHHAEMVTAKRLHVRSCALPHTEEERLDKVQRRFLTAVRELGKVRQLLKPETRLQVNIVA